MYRLPLFAALALGGCAATGSPALPPAHPASASAPTTPLVVAAAALPPVEQPDLPAPLRPDGHPPAGSTLGLDPAAVDGMDHSQMPGMTPMDADDGMAEMDHGQMDHGRMDHETMASGEEGMMDTDMGEAPMDHAAMGHGDAPMPNDAGPAMAGMSAVLDAYLAIHDALVADRLDGVPAQAGALDAALTTLTAEAPADNPHLWHTHAADLDAVHTQAQALAEASDLEAARVAFGELNVPFIRLVEATGMPEGYELARMTCGMAPGVPEGGVWLQRSGETANPYFGTAMPSCGTSEGAMPGMDGTENPAVHHTP